MIGILTASLVATISFPSAIATVPVTIDLHGATRTVMTSADDVGAALEEAGIELGAHDVVQPALSERIRPNETIVVNRVIAWTRTEHTPIAAHTVQTFVVSLAPGTTRVVTRGRSGVRESTVRYAQTDDGRITRVVLATHVVRAPQSRVVAQGISEYDAFMRFADRGLKKTAYIASSALRMIATAYTASCYGCSGYTALGYPAGHGIVAVDPRVIPLGTKLFIPGYGVALAGDTGGAIRGNRIDLGFTSERAALQFGRREIVVYRLR